MSFGFSSSVLAPPATRADEQTRNTHYAVAGAMLVLTWVAFSWPWLSGTVTIPWDAKAHFAPQIQFIAQSFAAGEWPWWNPFAFAGHPQIADPQSLLFSPPALLIALISDAPSLWLIDCVTLLMLLVAGFGVLWLAADQNWHWVGGLVAAIGFAFGAAMAWRLQHLSQVFSLAYWPFAFVLLSRALRYRSVWYGLAAGVLSTLIVLGRNQVGLLGVYVLALFVVWHWLAAPNPIREIRVTLPRLIPGGVLGLTLIALPLLMTLQFAAISTRPHIDYPSAAAGSLHPALLLTGLVPHLFGAAGAMADYWGPPSLTWENTGLFLAQNMGQAYIGAIAVIGLFVGLTRGDLWGRDIGFLALAFALVLLYALGGYTPAFGAMYHVLPGIDLFRRPADAMFLIGGFAALLAGYGVHKIFSRPFAFVARFSGWATCGVIVAGFLVALGCAFAFARLPEASPGLLSALAWFVSAACVLTIALWLKPIRPVLAGALVGVHAAADVTWNNSTNGATALPAAQLAMLEPDTDNDTITTLTTLVKTHTTATHRPRVEILMLGFHWVNAAIPHKLENTLGYNPLRLSTYVAATGAPDLPPVYTGRKFTPLLPDYTSLLAQMLGVTYIASPLPISTQSVAAAKTPSAKLKLLTRTKAAFIYAAPNPFPRVQFIHNAQTADFANLRATGQWPKIDFSRTLLLDTSSHLAGPLPGSPSASLPASESLAKAPAHLKNPAHPKVPATHQAYARILSYRNTEIVVEAQSANGGWVLLNDLWHPWWFAEVSGKRVPIAQANVMFRAVRIPAGKVDIKFTFRPIQGAIGLLFKPTR